MPLFGKKKKEEPQRPQFGITFQRWQIDQDLQNRLPSIRNALKVLISQYSAKQITDEELKSRFQEILEHSVPRNDLLNNSDVIDYLMNASDLPHNQMMKYTFTYTLALQRIRGQ